MVQARLIIHWYKCRIKIMEDLKSSWLRPMIFCFVNDYNSPKKFSI
jgi:hypothetical protein